MRVMHNVCSGHMCRCAEHRSRRCVMAHITRPPARRVVIAPYHLHFCRCYPPKNVVVDKWWLNAVYFVFGSYTSKAYCKERWGTKQTREKGGGGNPEALTCVLEFSRHNSTLCDFWEVRAVHKAIWVCVLHARGKVRPSICFHACCVRKMYRRDVKKQEEETCSISNRVRTFLCVCFRMFRRATHVYGWIWASVCVFLCVCVALA